MNFERLSLCIRTGCGIKNHDDSTRSVILLSLVLIMGVLVVGCAQDRGKVTPISGVRKAAERGTGVLTGSVTIGPMSPVEGMGGPGQTPLPGARIIISDLQGQEITSVVSDEKGVYRISLPPGTYKIKMPVLPSGGRFTKDLPATVTITQGQETRLDIRIDTGIR